MEGGLGAAPQIRQARPLVQVFRIVLGLRAGIEPRSLFPPEPPPSCSLLCKVGLYQSCRKDLGTCQALQQSGGEASRCKCQG